MNVPEGSVLAKCLSQLVTSSLRIDGQPSLDQVKKYQEHLQSEMETLYAAGSGGASSKVRAMAATGIGKEGHDGGSPEGKGDCRFFLKAAGCR